LRLDPTTTQRHPLSGTRTSAVFASEYAPYQNVMVIVDVSGGVVLIDGGVGTGGGVDVRVAFGCDVADVVTSVDVTAGRGSCGDATCPSCGVAAGEGVLVSALV